MNFEITKGQLIILEEVSNKPISGPASAGR